MRVHLSKNVFNSKKYPREKEGTSEKQTRCQSQKRRRNSSHAATHGGPHTRTGGHFLKKSYSMEDPHYSRFFPEDCHPWRGPALEQGKNYEEEGVTEMKHFGLSAIPHSSPSTAWGE